MTVTGFMRCNTFSYWFMEPGIVRSVSRELGRYTLLDNEERET
jgi:hypothetical protein